MRGLTEPGKRDLDYRPAGRWGPSYVGRVKTMKPVQSGQDEWTLVCEPDGPIQRRWPLGRRLVWAFQRALRLT